MSKVKDKIKETFTYDDVGGNLISRLKSRKSRKIHVFLWALSSNFEDCIFELDVDIDSKDFEYKGKRYIIDRNKIQNRVGQLIYNHELGNTTGGLSFIKPSDYKIDGKNYAEGIRREHFTSLWGRWKLPFIALLIAIGLSVVLGMLAMIGFLGQDKAQDDLLKLTNQLNDRDLCLNDLTCLNENLAKVKARIQLEEQRDEPPKPPVRGS